MNQARKTRQALGQEFTEEISVIDVILQRYPKVTDCILSATKIVFIERYPAKLPLQLCQTFIVRIKCC
jgi:hypothetical protein